MDLFPGFFVSLASSFAQLPSARKRSGAQRRMQQQKQHPQQQHQQQQLQQDLAAAARAATTPAAAAVATARAAAAANTCLTEGQSLLVLMGILSSRIKSPEAFPQVYRQLNNMLPRVLYQLTGNFLSFLLFVFLFFSLISIPFFFCTERCGNT